MTSRADSLLRSLVARLALCSLEELQLMDCRLVTLEQGRGRARVELGLRELVEATR